jgi:hypothetical protein
MRGITYRDLVAFASGELRGPAAATVEAYLAADPEAASTVKRFRAARLTYLGDDGVEPPAQAVNRAKAIFAWRPAAAPWRALGAAIARLIFDSRAEPAWAWAGLRGGSAGACMALTYETGRTTIDLEAQRHGEHVPGEASSWRLLGQVDDPDHAGPWEVTLLRRGQELPSVVCRSDERGYFELDASTGPYDAYLRHDDQSVVLPGIDLP